MHRVAANGVADGRGQEDEQGLFLLGQGFADAGGPGRGQAADSQLVAGLGLVAAVEIVAASVAAQGNTVSSEESRGIAAGHGL